MAIAISLCPQRVEGVVHNVLREKFAEKIARMQRGDETAFEEVFRFACPKFIHPAASPLSGSSSADGRRAMEHQVKLFMREVKQQLPLITTRSYLKLYSTIQLSNLSTLLDSDDTNLITSLMCVKHKMRQLNHVSGEPLSGKWTTCSDVDFYIDKKMVHIAEYKPYKHYGDYFVRQLQKLMDLDKSFQHVEQPQTAATSK